MKIGFVGLGKLGLPVALAIENKGHEVVGTDINPEIGWFIQEKAIPYMEWGTPELLHKTNIKFVSLKEVIEHSDIVFVPIQTPHDPKYEGITEFPVERKDFDYTFLRNGVRSICDVAKKQEKHIIMVVISTMLPGTFERELRPFLNEYVDYCYNPSFIAMGTTRADFESPEFVLLGCENKQVSDKVVEFYKTIHSKPCFVTSIINAELIKVVYNTFISTKIAFINTIMEVCQKVGADVDEVSRALSLATDRIISPKYLKGGMGDGGGCHPRDNIALSWLAQQIDLSYDFFESIMVSREKQVEWLADLIQHEHTKTFWPVVIMGVTYKKDINLTVGSPVGLLKNILTKRGIKYEESDPYVYPGKQNFFGKAVYFIGMNHSEYSNYEFPDGSVVIDPWGVIKSQRNVRLVRLGRYDIHKS